MILHTIDAVPGSPAFSDCLRLVAEEDAILLLGSAVYAVRNENLFRDLIGSGAAIYLLADHAQAAGVQARDGVAPVDMDGFVALSENYPRQQAWY